MARSHHSLASKVRCCSQSVPHSLQTLAPITSTGWLPSGATPAVSSCTTACTCMQMCMIDLEAEIVTNLSDDLELIPHSIFGILVIWRQLINSHNTHCPTIASHTLPWPFAQRSICALWPLVHPSIQLHQPFTHTTSEAGLLVVSLHTQHTHTAAQARSDTPLISDQQAAMFSLVHAPSQINRRGMYPGLFASDNFFDGPFWASRPSRPLQSSWTHPR